VARPLAFGAEGDIPYIVFADLAGTAMDAVMRQHGPRPVAEVVQRATQVAEAIDCAASAGVHHGMLAPCDIILDAEQTGVTGFGLAQALIKAGLPAAGVSPYGSPQRLAGAPATRADDIYSLAAITLELLIGTPRDPEQDTSRALREAQGLPERRRMPRPAPHETRVFTTIAGIDAGKLRAAFAAAFSEEPRERPPTAAEFVASLLDAISNKRVIDEPAPSVVAAPSVSDEPDDPPSVPVLETKRAEVQAAVEPPPSPEPVVTEPPARERAPEPPVRERAPERPPARPEPIVDVEFAEVTPPSAHLVRHASYAVPVRSTSRAFLAAAIVAVSFGAGFGGGFVVGHFSKPSSDAVDVSAPARAHEEPVAPPQPARAAAEDPKPVAATTPAVPAIAEKKVSIESGRLVVRSTPPGAAVAVDGQSRGITPLALGDLAFGAHAIEVSHPGHDTRRRRVTLSERRPARSLDFELRPTSVPAAAAPAPATAATDSTGSLQVASRPSGAQVYVDDNLIGTTPLLLSNVAAGSRHLRVELSGYKVWTTSVQIEPSGRRRVSASLEP
jgi:serine/threonine-protein kinase